MKTAQIAGEAYLSVSQASEMLGYSRDYIGQLCRSGSLTCKRSSGQWFVLQENVIARTNKSIVQNDSKVSVPVVETDPNSFVHKVKAGNVRQDALVFDGEEYVTSARAAELTGYAQDYVGELARSKEIRARKVGRHWLVHKREIIEHKKQKDSLLAHVQADSAGFSSSFVDDIANKNKVSITTRYYTEDHIALPVLATSDAVEPDTIKTTDQNIRTDAYPGLKVLSRGSTSGAETYFPNVSTESYKVRIQKIQPNSHDTSKPAFSDSTKNAFDAGISAVRDGGVLNKKTTVAHDSPYAVSSKKRNGAFVSYLFFTLLVLSVAGAYWYGSSLIVLAQKYYAYTQNSAVYKTISNVLPGRSVRYDSAQHTGL